MRVRAQATAAEDQPWRVHLLVAPQDASNEGVLAEAARWANEVGPEWMQSATDVCPNLGDGHFGDVRLAVHPRTGAWFAVKSVKKQKFSEFKEARQSSLDLSSERTILAALQHHSIVRLHEWYEVDARVHMAMEVLSGGNLLEVLLPDGPLPEGRARKVL